MMKKGKFCIHIALNLLFFIVYTNLYASDEVMVIFKYYTQDNDISSVNIVGDMTEWALNEMIEYEPEGYFYRRYMLKSGRYEYYYLIDNEPLGDMSSYMDSIEPQPDDYENDGYGGSNAILEVSIDETDDEVGLLVFRFYMDSYTQSLCDTASNKNVTLFGNINAWNGDDLTWNENINAYEIKYYGLEPAHYEFYFTVCDTPLWDMHNFAGYYEPEADYYLSDGWYGSNAVVVYEGLSNSIYTYEEGELQVDFKFFPNNRAYDFCYDYDDMEVSLYGSMNQWEEDEMDWKETEECFIQTYYLPVGTYEFYFSICDTPIENMSYYARFFEPAADYYQGDGMGGENAVIEVNEDGVYYSTPKLIGQDTYHSVFRYYPIDTDNKIGKYSQVFIQGDMTDHTNALMEYLPTEGYYEITFELPMGEYAYHYILNNEAVTNMKTISRQFEPPSAYYETNQNNIKQAVVEVNSEIEMYYDYQKGTY